MKYIGKIYEGRYKVIKRISYGDDYRTCRSGKYLLRNIYNNNELTLKYETLKLIDEGKKRLSKVISNKIILRRERI